MGAVGQGGAGRGRVGRAGPHLRQAAVVLLGLHHLTAVVLQVEEDHNLAYPEVLHCALSHSLLEVTVPAQHLQIRWQMLVI